MIKPAPILRAAGFCFTWRRISQRQARVSLWRVVLTTGRRYWGTCAIAGGTRDAIRARALALLAMARSIPLPVGRSVEAQAVILSLAITARRLSRIDVTAPFANDTPAANPHARAA